MGCQLLTDKLSYRYPMPFRCFCGKVENTKNYRDFYKNPFCCECEIYRYLELIETFFASTGCVLLSTDVVLKSTKFLNDTNLLEYVCKCGDTCSKTLLKFQKSPQCKGCDSEKYLSVIKQYYEKYDCILISENLVVTSSRYFQDPTPLQYYCSCGRPYARSLSNFIREPYCDVCACDINFNQILIEDFITETEERFLEEPVMEISKDIVILGKTTRPRLTLNFADSVKEFLKYGYTLLETEDTYIGPNRYSRCLCPKNHKTKSKLYNLKNGEICCERCVSEKNVHNSLGNFIKEKFIESSMKKYGVSSILDLKHIQEKIRSGVIDTKDSGEIKTLVLLYNMINPVYYSEMNEKRIAEFFESLSALEIDVQEFINRIRSSYFDKYQNPSNLPGYSEQSIQLCIDVLNNIGSMNIQIPKLKSRRWKDYTLPSGKIAKCQGYESFCFDDLLYKEGYSEEEILNERDDMPKILYDFEDKEHRYFPDFYIPKENRIIEVKSTYFFDFTKEKNMAKGHATKKLGFNYEIRIYSPTSEIIETIVF